MKKTYLHILIILLFAVFFSETLSSQTGFTLPEGKKSGKLKFELINNLIVIPVEVNDVKLSFILDTGVSSTLLFGATTDSLLFKNTSRVTFRGLGDGDPVEALKSTNNTVKVGKAFDQSHSLYLIFDETLNLSPRMGVPIHGILGYDFFKDFIIAINYSSKVIKYYNPISYTKKRSKRYKTYPVIIKNKKPFVDNVTINNMENLLMLIDTGSSDAIWVFDDLDIISETEENYFNDFLGLSLSGSIYGKRSKVNTFNFGGFSFNEVNVAILDSKSIIATRMINGRKGSLGSQIIKRFHVIFDYPNKTISLRKNKEFKTPFYYNMSGLTLEHNGISVVKNKRSTNNSKVGSYYNKNINESIFNKSPVYNVYLAPTVVVAEVRENSAADLEGVKEGDIILQFNGKNVYEYKLHEINSIFSSSEGKLVKFKIDRNGEILIKKFYLKKLF